MKTIDILVSPTGEVRLETRGFTGSSCREASGQLEAALGLKQSETLTAEHHQSLPETAPQSQRTGQ